LIVVGSLSSTSSSEGPYDIVILNGRVIDPESRSDSIRNVGISNGAIKTVTTNKLQGRTVIDARGLVVSPGFIDLHQHGQPAKYAEKIKLQSGLLTTNV
jgi:N-acyl-D-aspartate/D-glutamate deacylase